MQLEPCPSCHRHVHTEESVCPFCAASIETAMAAASPRAMPDRRLGRAALVSFGLTVAAAGGAAALQGCDNNVAVYGGPPQPDDASMEQPPLDHDAGKGMDAGNLDAGASDAGRADAGDAGDAGA